MIRVNLLPHREVRRKAQQQQFFIMLGTVVAIGAGIWFGVVARGDPRPPRLPDGVPRYERQRPGRRHHRPVRS